MDFITPAQCRAARGLLNWSQPDLANRCDVHVQTISKFELENGSPTKKTLTLIKQTFENFGVLFTQEGGVNPRISNHVTIFRGHEGFTQFRKLILDRAKKAPLNVFVSNVDERHFSKWGGEDMNNAYRKEMAKIGTVHFKIIIKENDDYLTASKFAEYRCVPENEFDEVPYYIFDDNLVLIPFEKNEMNLFIINNSLLAKSYKKQFERSWLKAKPVKSSFPQI